MPTSADSGRNLIQGGCNRAVEVAPGIRVLRYTSGPYAGRYALEHACPGVYRDPGDPAWVIAPIIASDLVSDEPLTFSPSLLCMGSARPCGLHGFVRDGAWEDAGTPAETAQVVRDEALTHG